MKNGELINLPAYAKTKKNFPEPKINFINRNREYLKKYRSDFKNWIKDYKVDAMMPSYQNLNGMLMEKT